MGEPTIKQLSDSALHRRVVSVPNGAIDGDVIRFIGLEATITDVFVRFIWLDGSQTTAIARPNQPWVEIVAQRSAWQVAGDYTADFSDIVDALDTGALVPAQAYVANLLQTFKESPPRQKPASFSLNQVMEQLQTAGGSK